MSIKILIVEDKNIEANDIKNVLESIGYEVPYIAYSGEKAIKMALKIMPDLILIDIQITGTIDGIDTAAKIKELNIPVIYIKAHSDEFNIERALSTEPYGYLIKPFDKNELQYVIESALFKNKMSKKLKASEEKYRRLAENSKDMIYLMTIPEGKYQYVNSSAENITGYTPEEFYQSTRLLLKAIHPDYKEYYRETWEKLLNSENSPDYEYKIITKHGKEKWLNQRNTLIKDLEGNSVAIEGIVTDITERKNAEEALKKREIEFHNENRKLLRAQRVAKIGIWENNLTTNELQWTEEMYKILGFNPNKKINLEDAISIFPQEELKRFQLAVDAAISQNVPYSLDYKIIRPDGKTRYIHDEGQVIRDDSSKPKKMFGTTQDITERKLVEMSLKESESKFRNLIETSPDIIWEINTEGIFSYISPQTLPILGYKPQEIIGRSIFSIISPKAVEKTKKSFMSHVDGSDKFNTLEVPALSKDNSELIIEIRSVRMTDNKGNIYGFQGIARDITDKTIATNQLKTSIKEKDVLLREIHHRVKNNMQIISSLLSLQMTHIDDGNAVNLLKESQNRVRSMAIIHDKLYQSYDLTRINLTEYIKSLVNGLFYSYSVKDHINSIINVDDVQLNIETAVPFGLILNELISNSLKHGFPGGKSGELYIRLKIVDDKYEMIVGDTGIGFPEDLDFKKTDSLGLQLVNNLVSQIDGEIELNKNHGTEFKIIFNELKYKERM